MVEKHACSWQALVAVANQTTVIFGIAEHDSR